MWVTKDVFTELLRTRSCLLSHILQIIFFCVQRKKQLYAGLEQSGSIMTEFVFLGEP